ncbi:carbohydrate ABC transporter permease [Bifidobacterium callitrichos]|uniref:Putative binding-protein dependent transport system integral membrane component n=1 Tax=Bifidobacterium callitrichos DSM 23973 TaxID=1437609 RepID=A0A087A628_9BIFI|nr:carbohydrate ABC transporter permease [Bifidobacterium callitrichos]KFI54228.1 putative binding-protein dependent transport system integral membrane component [Bifidobacterium callitrichos DSM 23973]
MSSATITARNTRIKRRKVSEESGESSANQVKGTSKYFVLGLLVFLSVYAVAPLWWLIVAITKSTNTIYTTNGLWFADKINLFQNLHDLFTYQDGIYATWLWNTVWLSFVTSAGAMVITVAAGYALAKYQFAGKKIIMGLIMASFIIPGTLLTVPSFILFQKVGLYDNWWVMILPSCFTPMDTYLAKVYAEGAVPDELMEAARIDGANEYRIFTEISWKLMVTPAATIFLLHFVASWNSFMWPMIFLKDYHKWTVMLGLQSWIARGTDSQYDLTMLVITGAFISMIPVVILMIAMQRYWKSGVTVGSLK